MELHEFFMQVPTPLVIMSGPAHVFTLANIAYEKLIGKPILGKSVKEAFTTEEVGSFIPLLDEVYQTGIPYKGNELLFPMKNQSGVAVDMWVNIEYYPFFGKSGKITGVLGFINDVTEVVKARKIIEKSEQFFRQTVLDLEKESQFKEIFVSTLSHDLRTPLTVAKLSAQSLARKLEDQPQFCKMAQRISVNMDRADRLIQDLLDASLIKAGEILPLRITPCSMNTLILSVIEELSSIHKDRFEVNFRANVDGLWDSLGIRRVLENLLLNGIKYGQENRPVSICMSMSGEYVNVSVHNEGTHIIPEELVTLFDRFNRTSIAKSSHQKGWGLGLTLVKGIIEAHGGNVNVVSLEGEGTTFTLQLPLDSNKFCNQRKDNG